MQNDLIRIFLKNFIKEISFFNSNFSSFISILRCILLSFIMLVPQLKIIILPLINPINNLKSYNISKYIAYKSDFNTKY